MADLNHIVLALVSAPPEALVAIVAIGEMLFMYLILKAFISIFKSERKSNEQ